MENIILTMLAMVKIQNIFNLSLAHFHIEHKWEIMFMVNVTGILVDLLGLNLSVVTSPVYLSFIILVGCTRMFSIRIFYFFCKCSVVFLSVTLPRTYRNMAIVVN